ncbi:hypothetical protein SALBM311S_09424 [Streptomyces alboniger]
MHIGVSTELEIARAVDSGDLDPVNVHPLPAQKAILDAFIQLGFRFKNADMERGLIRGTRQRLPFYQEIEFLPPQQYRGLNQVELSFVADANAMDVILEMDKKPGLFSEGSDTFRSSRWVCTTTRAPTGPRTSTSGCPRSAASATGSRLGSTDSRTDQEVPR